MLQRRGSGAMSASAAAPSGGARPEYRPSSPFPFHWLLLGGMATYMLSKRPEKGASRAAPLPCWVAPDGVCWGAQRFWR